MNSSLRNWFHKSGLSPIGARSRVAPLRQKLCTLFGRSGRIVGMVLLLPASLLGPVPVGADVTVYAAASLTDALGAVAQAYQTETGVAVKLSFAASSALAKQIEQGAPADLFASADTKWIDYLDAKGRIDHDSRRDLLGNELVLIAPAGKGFPVRMAGDFDLTAAFSGTLCTGVTESVPVGMYAKEALTRLGWWNALKSRVVGSEDVRAALSLVARGECDAGIVYATDARQSKGVEVIGRFPEDSHAPIVYPFVLVTQSGDAKEFLRHLATPAALEVFARYGFKPLRKD